MIGESTTRGGDFGTHDNKREKVQSHIVSRSTTTWKIGKEEEELLQAEHGVPRPPGHLHLALQGT